MTQRKRDGPITHKSLDRNEVVRMIPTGLVECVAVYSATCVAGLVGAVISIGVSPREFDPLWLLFAEL